MSNMFLKGFYMFQAYAQTTSSASCGIFSFGPCTTVTKLLEAITDSFFAVVWIVAIIFFIYAGLLWITSAGDKGKAETAKTALTNAIIGLVIILGVNVIVDLLSSLLQGGANNIGRPTIGGTVPGL